LADSNGSNNSGGILHAIFFGKDIVLTEKQVPAVPDKVVVLVRARRGVASKCVAMKQGIRCLAK
jgi:hypothetical protein